MTFFSAAVCGLAFLLESSAYLRSYALPEVGLHEFTETLPFWLLTSSSVSQALVVFLVEPTSSTFSLDSQNIYT